jgi:CDP-diacylglycerol--serine O-phosphatidyltransferase
MSKFRLRKPQAEERAARRARFPIRTIIPNLVTLLAAASGITSIRYSCQGNWHHASSPSSSPACWTGVDGRVARLLKATSKLGAELDSLSDFVSFGVAPALMILLLDHGECRPRVRRLPLPRPLLGHRVFLRHVLRLPLARFNTMLDSGPTQPYWKYFFLGLPAPGGAGLVLTPAIWQIQTGNDVIQSPWVGCIALLVCGVLMSSRFPTILRQEPARARQVHGAVSALRHVHDRHARLAVLAALGVIGMFYSPQCGLRIIFLRMRKRHELRNPAPRPAGDAPAQAPSPPSRKPQLRRPASS